MPEFSWNDVRERILRKQMDDLERHPPPPEPAPKPQPPSKPILKKRDPRGAKKGVKRGPYKKRPKPVSKSRIASSNYYKNQPVIGLHVFR